MARAFYRPLDFGTGVYTTSSKAQARRWVANRLEFETEAIRGFINIYAFDEAAFAESGLKRLDFSQSPASVEWLRFVMRNRRGRNPEHGYDLVTGPVANDRVYTVISAYEAGFVGEAEEAASAADAAVIVVSGKSGIEVGTDTVDDLVGGFVEPLRQGFFRKVLLILSDADRLRIDLDEFG